MFLNTIKNSLKALGVVSGSLLVGLPLMAQPASVQTEGEINPCPRIYYEEPFNSSTLVPEGCPPNAISQQLGINQATAPSGVTLGNSGDGQITNQAASPRPGIFDQAPYTSQPGGELPGADLTPQAINPADAPTTAPGAFNRPGTAETLPVQPPLPGERSQPVASIMPMDGMVDVQLTNNTNAIVTYEVIGDTQRRVLPGGEQATLRGISLPATITAVRQDDGLLRMAPIQVMEGMVEVSLDEEISLDDNQGVLRIQEDGQIFLN